PASGRLREVKAAAVERSRIVRTLSRSRTMDAALRAKIIALLDEHRILSLATLRPDGWPQATTVGYVNDGLAIYFMCGRDSQKAKNLARDDRVSLTIDRDTTDPMAIRGLSMAARAVPVTEQ